MSEASPQTESRAALSERWARYVASQAFSFVPIMLAAIALAVSVAFRDLFAAIVALLLAALWWERTGFRRLLARKDAEIGRLRATQRDA